MLKCHFLTRKELKLADRELQKINDMSAESNLSAGICNPREPKKRINVMKKQLVFFEKNIAKTAVELLVRRDLQSVRKACADL